MKTYVIGIDAGSTMTKGVLWQDGMLATAMEPTGWSPKQAVETILGQWREAYQFKDEDICLVATGYGRIAISQAVKTVTEITCHGQGARYLHPAVRTVIDIGGQDSKVIALDAQGQVKDFMMNDKCAAGTGKFLQVTTAALGEELSNLDQMIDKAEAIAINSMCTVFAESEIIGLLAQNKPKSGILKGVLASIAQKVKTMVAKVHLEEDVFFSGGLAQSQLIAKIFSETLECQIYRSPLGVYTGAIGAALIGAKL